MFEDIVIDLPITDLEQGRDDYFHDSGTSTSEDRLGHLSGPRRLVEQGFPFMPCLRIIRLRFRRPYDLSCVQSSAVEKVWHGGEVSDEVYERVIEVAPFVEDVVREVRKVNMALRARVPNLEEIVWDMDGAPKRDSGDDRSDQVRVARYAFSAKKFVDLVIVKSGYWKGAG